MLNSIKSKMEDQFNRAGVIAEVTFISTTSFSIAVDDAAQFTKAKQIMAALVTAKFDGEVCDEECGNFAYYKF